MPKKKVLLVLAGLLLFVCGIAVPNVYAADKTLHVNVMINSDFWNSKITFPNGNKAEINGIAVVLVDKGVPQIFKTLTAGQNQVTFDYTSAEGSDCQLKIPFLAGPGASVYQIVEKIRNDGQSLTYTIGVDTIHPLTIERTQQ
ncbi:hypothetical protein [Sporomusa acidovorans]|uniref:Uncharacterized protein n=1 Tax=Sporomusa acidovorans (strain ATCC 49682 / DSM 3132 / Mol) TaxID=1123286 RepID=A0ABZ3IW38_SPOA4|nr:hypothetical protein [Sporomusa acidovorans]OZC23583.1 hypothetical protein SPACI_04850 [Sporomusa acidovorans DSM 3132]SDE21637.1 hypothetical protein SAMN04488499_10109 [Sporomusa acidovorans]